MKPYSEEFYLNRHKDTIYSANTILSILFAYIPGVQSAIDIGCGVGTWLSVLQKKGVKHIQGLDGSWVNQDLLVIPRDSFNQVDLDREEIRLSQRYDLAISLEVAEHLPVNRAEEFVSSLTALSDHVLFSAAIPFQGGVNHLNEQWQHYWVEKFEALNYHVHDLIRPKIWNDHRIPFWYRQNILVFSYRQTSRSVLLNSVDNDARDTHINLVHPDLYLSKANTRFIRNKKIIKLFLNSVRNSIVRMISRNSLCLTILPVTASILCEG